MGDEQVVFEPFLQSGREFIKTWGRGDHLVIDAGQMADEGRNRYAWIDQGAPFTHPLGINFDQADFDDAVVGKVCAGGFQIDKN